jgi:hypothetical protein
VHALFDRFVWSLCLIAVAPHRDRKNPPAIANTAGIRQERSCAIHLIYRNFLPSEAFLLQDGACSFGPRWLTEEVTS